MKCAERLVVLFGILALIVLSWAMVIHGVRRIVTSEPQYVMPAPDIVHVLYKERVYKARYEAGNRVYEVLEDNRFGGGSCKPRVEVGNVFVLDYRCDEKGRTERNPSMFKSFDDLIPQIVDDFNTFRPLADAYYVKMNATH